MARPRPSARRVARLSVAFALATGTVPLLAAPARAADPVTLHVETGGHDDPSNNCQNADAPCLTIQHAAEEAASLPAASVVTIEVAAGHYPEAVVIDGSGIDALTSLTIQGTTSPDAPVQVEIPNGAATGFTIHTTAPVTVTQLQITQASGIRSDTDDMYGVRVTGTGQVTLSGLDIHDLNAPKPTVAPGAHGRNVYGVADDTTTGAVGLTGVQIHNLLAGAGGVGTGASNAVTTADIIPPGAAGAAYGVHSVGPLTITDSSIDQVTGGAAAGDFRAVSDGAMGNPGASGGAAYGVDSATQTTLSALSVTTVLGGAGATGATGGRPPSGGSGGTGGTGGQGGDAVGIRSGPLTMDSSVVGFIAAGAVGDPGRGGDDASRLGTTGPTGATGAFGQAYGVKLIDGGSITDSTIADTSLVPESGGVAVGTEQFSENGGIGVDVSGTSPNPVMLTHLTIADHGLGVSAQAPTTLSASLLARNARDCADDPAGTEFTAGGWNATTNPATPAQPCLAADGHNLFNVPESDVGQLSEGLTVGGGGPDAPATGARMQEQPADGPPTVIELSPHSPAATLVAPTDLCTGEFALDQIGDPRPSTNCAAGAFQPDVSGSGGGSGGTPPSGQAPPAANRRHSGDLCGAITSTPDCPG